jgi:drug/metabolite transporter (DMT)-like permease
MTGLQDTFMKYLSGDYPFHELQVIRSGMAVVLVAIAGALTGGFTGFSWAGMRPVILRGLLLGAGSAFYYVSLAAMTLADATAIYFALPLIVAALSGLMIREEVKSWRWIAAGAGFIGVLATIKPGSSLFEPAAILTLIATCLYAAGNLSTRRIGPQVPPLVIALFGGISFMVVAVVLALIFGTGRFHSEAHPSLAFLTRAWVMPSLRDWGLLAGFGVATATGFFSFAEAYRKAPASFIAPFEYSAMIWAVLFGWWVFGDVPVRTTIMGSAIIIGSGLFLGWSEWRQRAPLGAASESSQTILKG